LKVPLEDGGLSTVFEKLTKEAFSENLNTTFRIQLDAAGAAEVELLEVVEGVSTPAQEQFSIVFRGPLEYFLPQHTYHVEHEKMGEMDIFIVPVGKEADGFRYEAVFNYIRQAE
jgi:hypothetical protein